jgi:hypothetical protein
LLVVSLLGLIARPAVAHRLDEYLQATILSIEPGTVQATLRMVPGVAVASAVITHMDTNHDGALSMEEQHRYALEVLADLRLSEDGRPLDLHLTSAIFPSIESVKLGTGEIRLAFSADLPSPRGEHQLKFENHHQESISVYLVNSLVPQDRRLHLTEQVRNPNQSTYRVTLTEAGTVPIRGHAWSGLGGAYHLGLRHIAEGTDHLLFLLTLLLPAPLLALARRWRGCAPVHQSLVQILRIVTAFTLGHSLTLALSVFRLVNVPNKPVEVLIAVSILISAIHALRPLFPGREALIAASFGLVHGLAFASALNELGVTGWYQLISLLGFNLGIETMQLAVVVVTLPALILLSRTPWYAVARIAGALFAIIASGSWIVERILNKPNVITNALERFARHGAMFTCVICGFSVFAWRVHRAGIFSEEDELNLRTDQ